MLQKWINAYMLFFYYLLIIVLGVYSFRIDTTAKKTDVSGISQRKQSGYRARIAGGYNGYIKNYPYIAHIFPTNCAGTIIGIKWILTIWDCNDNVLTVAVGVDTILNLSAGTHSVVRSYRHQRQGLQGLEKYQMLILQLRNELTYNERIQPVAIGTSTDIRTGELAAIAGFGQDERHPKKRVTPYLHATELIILEHDACKKKNLMNVLYLSENPDLDFCAGIEYNYPTPHTDTNMTYRSHCDGDNGAGLVIGRRIIGIALHSMGCGYPGIPGVFLSVPFASSWLYETLKDNITFTDTSAERLSVCPAPITI